MTAIENDDQYIEAVESITAEMRELLGATICPHRILELAEKLVEAREAWYERHQESLRAA
jgi:hypothetical protein